MIYDIHICEKSEKAELQKFINDHWKQGHIMSFCDELFDFMHFDPENERYNFLIARNGLTGEIDGSFGFIANSFYDPALIDDNAYYGVIWKVRDDVENPEIKILGTLLWRNITKLPSLKYYMTSGISDVAKKFYTIARLNVQVIKQYYILNDGVNEYKIAKIGLPTFKKSCPSNPQVDIRGILADDLQDVQYTYTPRKSVQYVKTRYFTHPIYNYQIYGIYNEEILQYGLICRKIETQGSACLRIVDIYGNIEGTPNIYAQLQDLMRSINCEYVDCLNYGIDSSHFFAMGFDLLDVSQHQIIVPNYFEPFLQQNIALECVHTPAPKFVVFKGDGDQDRPNMI